MNHAAPTWDLSVLFESPSDPRIENGWAEGFRRADAFESAYRGKINSPTLTAETLEAALKELEGISQEAGKPAWYGHLLFAADTSDPAIAAFMQKQMERSSELSVKLMFFDLELQKVPQSHVDKLLADPVLANYVHHINHSRAFTPHSLSEAEEVMIEELANTGSRAWDRLFDEVTSNHRYTLTLPGEEPKEAGQEEIIDLLRSSNREHRQAAADSFTAGLQSMERVLVFIFNTLLQDKAVGDRLRKYEFAEQSRHKGNELEKETVDLVIRLCTENYPLVARFYEVKKRILGLPELTHIDRYAPLFEAEKEVMWEEAKSIILDAFAGFSQEMKERAQEFFDKGWIDAEARKGKRGGAFCAYITPDTHPVLLQTYLGKMDDVMTLAHEMGHGVHASFSREQTLFNFHGTLPLAELASTFAEMMVFEKLTATASEKDKLALYAEKIEGVFATVFRQAAMFQFEQRIHVARREEGELAASDFGNIWQEELQAMFGSSITLGEQHRHWWSYVSHFVGSPFYVYAYSFGELLVLSLYQIAKEKGSSFADDYVALLKLGGSKSPAELMQTVGIDINSEAFWQGGFKVLEALVSTFETLWDDYAGKSTP